MSGCDEAVEASEELGMRMKGTWLAAILAVSALLISGCSKHNNSGPGTSTFNLSLATGAASTYRHVWVTVNAVALSSDSYAPWASGSSSWQVFTLPQPVTVDLIGGQGALNTVLSNAQVPAGVYVQMRLFFAMVGLSQTTASSAQAITDSNGQALQWSHQVEYLNGGLWSEAPLEIPGADQGVAVSINQLLGANTTYNLDIGVDPEHIIAPMTQAGQSSFVLSSGAQLTSHNRSATGAIAGKVSTAALCPVNAQQVPQTSSSCASNLVAKAEAVATNAAGVSSFVSQQSATVDPVTGAFTIYPLNGGYLYTVVIRGQNMQTLVINNVSVGIGTAASAPTNISVNPLSITTNAGSTYQAQLANALQPANSYVLFGQTDSSQSASVPYEVRLANTDPFAGILASAVSLENSGILSANYVANADPVFTQVTPVEGNGGYTARASTQSYYSWGASTVVSPVGAGATASVAPGNPALASSHFISSTLTANLSIANAQAFNRAQLVVTKPSSGIAGSSDISNLFGGSTGTCSGSGGSGSCTVSGLIGGTATDTVPFAYYNAYLRLWSSTASTPLAKIIPLGVVDLRSTNAVTLNVSASAQ